MCPTNQSSETVPREHLASRICNLQIRLLGSAKDPTKNQNPKTPRIFAPNIADIRLLFGFKSPYNQDKTARTEHDRNNRSSPTPTRLGHHNLCQTGQPPLRALSCPRLEARRKNPQAIHQAR